MGVQSGCDRIAAIPAVRLDTVMAVRDRLLVINMAVQLATGALDRADIYGDDVALAGVSDIFFALARLL